MERDRVAVATGATAGIGQWIALGLARAGYRVVLVGRDRARGEAVRGWIGGHVPDAATELIAADLSSMAATRALAAEIRARHPRLALLMNNAGAFHWRRAETAEGHEQALAVNHLAPFVLTRALAPALGAGAPARVINTGSVLSDLTGLGLDDLESRRRWNPLFAYARSKLALLMQTLDWAERLRGAGVDVNVVHPGAVATTLVREGGAVGFGWRALRPVFLTPEQGAEGPLHVALDPALTGIGGRYFKRRREARPNRLALDAALRERLWAETERLVGPG